MVQSGGRAIVLCCLPTSTAVQVIQGKSNKTNEINMARISIVLAAAGPRNPIHSRPQPGLEFWPGRPGMRRTGHSTQRSGRAGRRRFQPSVSSQIAVEGKEKQGTHGFNRLLRFAGGQLDWLGVNDPGLVRTEFIQAEVVPDQQLFSWLDHHCRTGGQKYVLFPAIRDPNCNVESAIAWFYVHNLD
jgi:hypothetical protein